MSGRPIGRGAMPVAVALAGALMALTAMLPVLASASAVTVTATPTCRPPAQHPRPVVLLHEFATTAADMAPLAADLRARGWCVVNQTYGRTLGAHGPGGMASVESSAAGLGDLVSRVRASTGASAVDLVGHGAGSLVAMYYLHHGAPSGAVRTLVSLAPLWSGTNLLGLGTADRISRMLGTYPLVLPIEAALEDRACAVCREVIADSDFITGLRGTPLPIAGVRMVNLATRYDELVWPASSGFAPGMTNLWLQDRAPRSVVEHFGIARAPAVIGEVRRALS